MGLCIHSRGRIAPLLLAGVWAGSGVAAEFDVPSSVMQALESARPAQPQPLAPLHGTPCVNGMAATYPCSNVDLLSFTPVATFSATNTNSLWGWTDPTTQIEYALIGANNGLAMFELSDPTHPKYLGRLPTRTGSSAWRDVRVYANHAYVVSDNNGAHGMQIFDLTRLRGVTSPQTFTEDAVRSDFGRGHTISINEATGFAYVAGSDTCPAPSANGALRIYDIRTPVNPVFVGCVPTGGYTHESQCFVYHGPDTQHDGKEICLNANGPTKRFAIVDVSNKAAPVTLSSLTWTGASYPHQAWFTEDQRYALLNDELDETSFGHSARTLVFDLADLDAPVLAGHHDHALGVIDHNLFIHGQYVYESNYEAGLRILRLGNLSQAQLSEAAYFDTYPASNNAEFNGNWNNYRFPASGNVILTGIDEGFFVVEPRLCTPPAAPTALNATASGSQQIALSWNGSGSPGAIWSVERAQGGCSGAFATVAEGLTTPTFTDTGVSGQVDYGYRVLEKTPNGQCTSVASACVQAQTTGTCSAAPLFGGISSVADAGTASCRLDLQWTAASPACGGPARYSVYRGDSAGFTPAAVNRIASGVTAQTFADIGVAGGVSRYYVVRAVDAANGAEDSNSVQLSGRATGPVQDGSFVSGAEPGDPLFDTSSVDPGLSVVTAPEHAGWHTSATRKRSGAQSFWSTSANNLCVSLVSQPLQLTAAQSAQLSFWSAWDIQGGRDGGVVEISTDNGANWTRLTPSGGYPGSITGGGTLCGIATGSGAFSGTNQLATWTRSQIDLAAYAGQAVRLRWLYRTDGATAGQGWFVDDIELTHAQVPGICTAGDDLIFKHSFE
ncbi:MAG: choice-of-anchor B family protein [Rhodanobacteraceae bacterium]|nr:choice-of-anchor B family protein [Rhodanobacteraceae bacterium]